MVGANPGVALGKTKIRVEAERSDSLDATVAHGEKMFATTVWAQRQRLDDHQFAAWIQKLVDRGERVASNELRRRVGVELKEKEQAWFEAYDVAHKQEEIPF